MMVVIVCSPTIVKFLPQTSQNLEVKQQIQIFGTVLQIKNHRLISYYWTGPLILDHSYLVGNLNKVNSC